MKEHIKGFFIISTGLLAIIGICNLYNMLNCGLETCPLILDRQTILMLRDQKDIALAYDGFKQKEPPNNKKK